MGPHVGIQSYCGILPKVMKNLPKGLNEKNVKFANIST
jgi:hypothetical protein